MSKTLTDINPFSPSPRGSLPANSDLVGREELLIDFWHFVDLSANGKLIPVILRANYGGGKTAALKWLTDHLRSNKNKPSHISTKKILPIYTRLSHPQITEVVASFVDGAKLIVEAEQRQKLENDLKTAIDRISRRGLQSEHISNCLIYVSSLDSLYSLGYDVIIHFIDEFEAIEELTTEQARGFLHEFRDFLDEIGERPVLLAIGCTDEAYRMLEELHPALVSRIPQEFRRQADSRLQFTLENALDFVATRMGDSGIKNPEPSNPYYPFDRAGIEYLYEKTNGNIRTMEQTCYFAMEQAREDNKVVTKEAIAKALHKVIKSKEGQEAKRQLFDLIDDPKIRRQIEESVKKATPEDLKQFVFEGFQAAVGFLSFDFQMKYRDEVLGELVGLAGINTHAYRTVPIDVLFFATTVPRDVGHSEIAECEKLRNQFKASLGIVLRLSSDSSQTVVSESTIDLAVPTHLVEAMTVLPHVSRLDADRLSRSLDADLELSRHLERWIKSKIEEGRIIGERFKQYEEPLYVALWESGEQRIKSDRLNDYLPERYSNATLKARLESLQEKKLVELKEDKAEWKFSPLMTETIRIIKDEFKGNPIAALDLRSYFVGGSIETLRQYLRIMTRIGVLHEVHIASHLAYKVPDTKAVLQRAQEQLGAWQQKLQQSTKYPAGLKAEIDRKTDLAKRSLETASIAYEKQDAISAASSCHRAIKLLADLDAAVHAIEDNVLKIEREYQRLRTRAEDISKKLGSVEGQDLSTWQRDLDNIIQNAKNAYEGDFKVRGRQEQTERAFVSANEQLNEVEEFLDGTVEMSRKLAGSIEQTQKLVSQIRSMSSRYQIQSSAEALQTIEDLFKEARLSYNNQDFTKAEFLLLKILQNELIRDMLQRVNLELADIEGNAKVVTDSAVSIGRITGGNFTEGIQDIRLHIAQARERMTSNELSESVRNLDDARAKISSEQNVLNQAISRWAEKVIPSNLPMGANEIAKNNSMSFELVVDALHLLLRNETIAVVRRG